MTRGLAVFKNILLCTLLGVSLVLAQGDALRMQELAKKRYGSEAAQTVYQWRSLISDISLLSDSQKLQRVNDFFNQRIRFVADSDTWQQTDYWATPLEFMGRKQGDCEDFSIAKYTTLLMAGVPMKKLRMTYVRAHFNGLNQAHMILAYYPYPNADPSLLDNVVQDIRPASLRKDLTPVFGFNSAGLWVGSENKLKTNNPGANLSRWRDLLLRMELDGLI
ncbi:MAG: transglutaminase-like cysteine peptidase [Pseudomonadales bacterium]